MTLSKRSKQLEAQTPDHQVNIWSRLRTRPWQHSQIWEQPRLSDSNQRPISNQRLNDNYGEREREDVCLLIHHPSIHQPVYASTQLSIIIHPLETLSVQFSALSLVDVDIFFSV